VPVILLGMALAMPAGAQAGDQGLSNIRIDNFGRVDANYYRGAQPEGRDYADLAALGVKSVINLTSDDAKANEKTMVEGAGMKYIQIPMTTHQPPTAAQLTEFFRMVNDPGSQPVYVHCVGGRHRTGVMTAVYRMSDASWTADRALAEMKQYKYGADFLHPEFKEFVSRYRPDIAPPVQAALVARTGT
jgi:protein tyrosine/serine phosphatase